jgi:DNA-binding NarL/FixJ family response regulator
VPQRVNAKWTNLRSASLSLCQIARLLSISETTARKHSEHVFEWLQVTSRTAAVIRAFSDSQE